MKKPIYVAVTMALAVFTVLSTGCAVMRNQESVGNYIDDATITTEIKAKFVKDSTVAAMAINVETLKGTVQLSGFAKSIAERTRAEELVRDVKGVVKIQNSIVVRN